MKRASKRLLGILLAVLITVLTALAGCSEYSYAGGIFQAGDEVTPRQLAEISARLAADSDPAGALPSGDVQNKTKSAATTAAGNIPRPLDTDTSGEVVVYWTKSGEVWHCDRDCASLANSASVISGSIDEARAAGKSRICQRCAKKIDPADIPANSAETGEKSESQKND